MIVFQPLFGASILLHIQVNAAAHAEGNAAAVQDHAKREQYDYYDALAYTFVPLSTETFSRLNLNLNAKHTIAKTLFIILQHFFQKNKIAGFMPLRF